MGKAHSVQIELLNQKITLKTEQDPEIVKEIIALASLKLEDAKRRVKGVAAHQVALLALLEMTEEYILAKKRAITQREQMNEKSGELLKLIEMELQ